MSNGGSSTRHARRTTSLTEAASVVLKRSLDGRDILNLRQTANGGQMS